MAESIRADDSPRYIASQAHNLAAYEHGAQACRIVQRLAEMEPTRGEHHCVFCGVMTAVVGHFPNCLWLLARQLHEKTE